MFVSSRRKLGAIPTTRQEEVRRGACDETGDPKAPFWRSRRTEKLSIHAFVSVVGWEPGAAPTARRGGAYREAGLLISTPEREKSLLSFKTGTLEDPIHVFGNVVGTKTTAATFEAFNKGNSSIKHKAYDEPDPPSLRGFFSWTTLFSEYLVSLEQDHSQWATKIRRTVVGRRQRSERLFSGNGGRKDHNRRVTEVRRTTVGGDRGRKNHCLVTESVFLSELHVPDEFFARNQYNELPAEFSTAISFRRNFPLVFPMESQPKIRWCESMKNILDSSENMSVTS
ncbi:hypothetical protein M5K25_014506 [Dendrobium thyrsiflorum]|uniref:Uncharacterized protein n=1 Tax=Dendrobium thyrsiflorum TaxID=117978 RepID=A0ABD0UWD0_DENTH